MILTVFLSINIISYFDRKSNKKIKKIQRKRKFIKVRTETEIKEFLLHIFDNSGNIKRV